MLYSCLVTKVCQVMFLKFASDVKCEKQVLNYVHFYTSNSIKKKHLGKKLYIYEL